MNRIVKELIRAVVIGCIAPLVLIGFVMLVINPVSGDEETTYLEPTLTATQPTQLPSPTEEEFTKMTIRVIIDGVSCEMELEEYILGVVLGEMPADFELEALKAQAVVARTYTMKAYIEQSRHKGAVCTKASCCQAYSSPSKFLDKGGSESGLQRVRQAVEETCGQVLTYEGELITATYFSCSGGSTEDAKAVWGYDVPYLQSVESPGEENSAAYAKETSFTPSEFQKKMAVPLSGDPQDWFGKVTHTEGSGVATIVIGGVTYRGTTIRSLLKLRSTNFTVRVEDEKIIFSTKGYGHRVGMSQYGADAMAVLGSTYDEILSHYYQGTQLDSIFSTPDGQKNNI